MLSAEQRALDAEFLADRDVDRYLFLSLMIPVEVGEFSGPGEIEEWVRGEIVHAAGFRSVVLEQRVVPAP
jgi:hypothetical protein